jgi:hypothetical protein
MSETVQDLAAATEQISALREEIARTVAEFARLACDYVQRTAPDIARNVVISNEARARELDRELGEIKARVLQAVADVAEQRKAIIDDERWPHVAASGPPVSRTVAYEQLMLMVRRLFAPIGQALFDARLAPGRVETPPKWGVVDGRVQTYDGTLPDLSDFDDVIDTYLDSMSRLANLEKQLVALQRRAAREDVAKLWDDA